jgi:pimeloyl-ACP methyl ester carboxylesterase
MLAWDGEGDGPALILIHGTGSSRAAWDSVVPLLAPQRRVFAIDLPGCGSSPALPAETTPTIPALADAVERWMAERDLGPAHVAGNSLGGGIALELAMRGAVSSATALSPIGFFNHREFIYGATSLRVTRLGAKALGPVAPLLFKSRAARTLLFAQALGRPWRMSAESAVTSGHAMATASRFSEGVKSRRRLPLLRRSRRSRHDRLGPPRPDPHLAPGRTRPPPPPRCPLHPARRLRPRPDDRRSPARRRSDPARKRVLTRPSIPAAPFGSPRVT